MMKRKPTTASATVPVVIAYSTSVWPTRPAQPGGEQLDGETEMTDTHLSDNRLKLRVA
jgi:hypothetical protein